MEHKKTEASATDDRSLHRQGGGCCCLSVGGGGRGRQLHTCQSSGAAAGGRPRLPVVICCRLTILQQTKVSVTPLCVSLLRCETCRCLSSFTDHSVEAEYLLKTASWQLERLQICDAQQL